VSDTYRQNADREELLREIEQLRFIVGEAQREERRDRWREWWSSGNGPLSVCSALLVVVAAVACLVVSQQSSASHGASIACLPGKAAEWRLWDRTVICEGGYGERWAANR
jgi:hypothetical protein